MEDKSSLEQVGEHNRLMTRKDFIIFSYFKMLLKEKDLALHQGLRAISPSGYHAMSNNAIKIFDPTVQSFN